MQTWKKGVIIAALLAFCAPAAWAEDFIETESVKVIVNRMEQALHDTNVSAAVVTAEDIKRDPAPTIAEQLKKIPGVMVHDGGMAGLPRVSIRGEGTSRVLLMVDGVRISDQKSMSGPAFLIDPADVERIEVIKGPASVLYGSEAIGGVINVITKKGGDKPIGGTAQMTYDSSTDSFKPYGSIAGNYEGFYYRASGDYVDADDRDTPDGKVKYTNYRHQNYSATAGYNWDHGNVFAGYEYFKGNLNVPYNSNIQMMKLSPWERETFKGGAEFNNFSDVLLNVKLTGYYQYTEKLQDMSMSPMMGYGLIKNKMDSYGANLQTDWLLPFDNYLIFGVDWNYDDLDSWTKNLSSGRMVSSKGKQSNLGIYLQDEWSVLEQLKIVGGVRYTWIYNDVNDQSNGKFDSNDDNRVGNIGVVYTPFRELALRANVSQGYKSPNLSERYIGNFGGTLLPNPDLDPEKSTNYEVGARFNSGDWNIDAAVYYADAKDFITSTYLPGSTTISQYINVDSAKTWGFELSVDYTYEPLGLTPYVVFNWMRRETKNFGYKTSKSAYPPFSGQVGMKWQRDLFEDHTFFADLNYMYNSSTTHNSASRGRTGVVTVTKYKYDSWGTLNLNMGFESHYTDCVNYFGSISLNNLFDKKYTPATASTMAPGFHVVATAGVTF